MAAALFGEAPLDGGADRPTQVGARLHFYLNLKLISPFILSAKDGILNFSFNLAATSPSTPGCQSSVG